MGTEAHSLGHRLKEPNVPSQSCDVSGIRAVNWRRTAPTAFMVGSHATSKGETYREDEE